MATQVDYDATKQVQQQVWSAGDFALVATATTNVGEELCDAVDFLRRNRMLRDRSAGPPENELSAIVNVTTGTTTPEEQA